MLILVDAMGGDNAPEEIVKGCIDAINESEGYDIVLIGDVDRINNILKGKKFDARRLQLHHTTEVITNDDYPTKAIKEKKDSSMVVGLKLLKEKFGDVFLSAGNSGALLAGTLLTLGRIKGVHRPALAPVIPTKSGGTMLIDAGLNTSCRPENLQQFGIIGSIYMKEIFGIQNPRVGLINVGSENRKGSEVLKQAYEKLSISNINFVGNVEGRELPEGAVDVAVCDGFVGNVLLKFLEGVGSYIFSGLKNLFSANLVSKLSSFLVRKELRNFSKGMDYEEYGGTPILGVNGVVFKCHGSSSSKAIKNTITRACSFVRSTVLEQIRTQINSMEGDNIEA
ncbi:MAG: phosphate acyltransferase PlsX [Acetivibrionales bacterium]